jgi:tetratricopeptide (TPR) repeat protein
MQGIKRLSSDFRMEYWKNIFRESKNQRTRRFLHSHGISSFALLQEAIVQLGQAATLDEPVLDEWVAVVKTFRHVNYLNEDGNQQCQDIAESLCRSLSTRSSIGAKNQAKFYFEWAKIQNHRRNIAESFDLIAAARRLDPGNWRYDLWYATARSAAKSIQPLEAIAIYRGALARLKELLENQQIAFRDAAYYLAWAHISLGNAGDGDEVQHYRDARRLAKAIGDRRLQAQALNGLGNASGANGNPASARMYFRRTLRLNDISDALRQRAQEGLERNSPKRRSGQTNRRRDEAQRRRPRNRALPQVTTLNDYLPTGLRFSTRTGGCRL